MKSRTARILITALVGVLLGGSADGAGGRKASKEKEQEVQAPVFYPAAPGIPRLQYLSTYNGSDDIEKKRPSRFMKFVLGEEEEIEKIDKPYGAVLHDSSLFVCDTGKGVVWIFDLVGNTMVPMGHSSPGRLKKPISIAIDDDGTRYVTDTSIRRVMVYNAENRYVKAYGDPETFKPTDVLIKDDTLYVCDVDQGAVLILDKQTGDVLSTIGEKGNGPGQLLFPTNIALDTEGNLFVSDTGSARVLKFDQEGVFVKQIGFLGRVVGSFTRPKGVALDKKNRLYVADAAFENVQVFDDTGSLLLFFGGPGAQPGSMVLPAGVSIDYDHLKLFKDKVAPGHKLEYLILVTNQLGPEKVSVYGFLKEQGE